MSPDPAELERQHLADLLEAMMRCAFFSNRLASSIPWRAFVLRRGHHLAE
jgi:hypothetical protein